MLRASARAKLNLALHVVGQRDDGYHLLESLVAFADVADEIMVEPSAEADAFTVDGPFATHVPGLASNSLGAALATVRRWKVDALAASPLHIRLTKNLPVAAGIGGGSADAAALITLLTKQRVLSQQERADCMALGADVPMCLQGQSALVDGVGDVRQTLTLPAAHVVLANPLTAVSTPAVFKALDQKTNPPLPNWPAPTTFDALVRWLDVTRNDLKPPALKIAPQIAACLNALREAPFAQMSGSGATCFALLPDQATAEDLAATTKNAHPDWWVRAGRLQVE